MVATLALLLILWTGSSPGTVFAVSHHSRLRIDPRCVMSREYLRIEATVYHFKPNAPLTIGLYRKTRKGINYMGASSSLRTNAQGWGRLRAVFGPQLGFRLPPGWDRVYVVSYDHNREGAVAGPHEGLQVVRKPGQCHKRRQ